LTELAPLTWDLIWLAAPAILLAGLVHGTFGIGFPMIATPLLALFTDVFSAVLICVIPTMSVNLATIWHGECHATGVDHPVYGTAYRHRNHGSDIQP
jgi:hypothetical protein